jgi:hypothetical protein
MTFQPMVDKLSPGKKGLAEVSIFEVSEEEASFSKLRSVVTQGRDAAVHPGRYAKLSINGELMMTDTQMERATNVKFVKEAKGNVLIAGLGLGMVLGPLLDKSEVGTILVVEKHQDVIDLIAPHFQKAIDEERLHILCDDIHNFKPDEDWLFNTVYFDIWPTICGDNLPEMQRLHNLFRYNLATGGWMSSWCYDHLEHLYRDRPDQEEDDDGDFGDEDDEYCGLP